MCEKKKVGRNKVGQFTKGNNFAVGNSSAGKYRKEYTEQLIEYFSKPPTRVEYVKHYDAKGNIIKEEPVVLGADYPTFEGFAIKIGVTAGTLKNWAEKNPTTFGRAYEMAKDMQKNMIVVNALGGRYNGNFAKFIASAEFDMAEKTKQEIGAGDGLEVIVNVKTPDQS